MITLKLLQQNLFYRGLILPKNGIEPLHKDFQSFALPVELFKHY